MLNHVQKSVMKLYCLAQCILLFLCDRQLWMMGLIGADTFVCLFIYKNMTQQKHLDWKVILWVMTSFCFDPKGLGTFFLTQNTRSLCLH